MQVRAIVEAAVEVQKAGGDPQVEIMIPLVATAPELQQMRAELEPVADEILDREGVELEPPRVGNDDRASAGGRDGR